MLKKSSIILTLISPIILGVNSCAGLPKDFPKDPEVVRYGVHADLDPSGFYSSDDFKDFIDPAMKGAQCVTAGDAKAVERYKASVKAFVIERCECK